MFRRSWISGWRVFCPGSSASRYRSRMLIAKYGLGRESDYTSGLDHAPRLRKVVIAVTGITVLVVGIRKRLREIFGA